MEDIESQIRDAYQHQQHSLCVKLIDSDERIGSITRFKILKASCLNNLPGKTKEAHDCLDDVLSTQPDNAFAFYGRGLVYINEGKLAEAVQSFDRAIELDPSVKMNKARQMKDRAERMLKPLIKLEGGPTEKTVRRTYVDRPVTVCPICNKSFLKPFSLSRHMLLHTGENSF